MKLDVVYNKSCQRMDEVPDECVDLMKTDPPYGIGFMGKDWDVFRVKKPTKSQSISWMSPGMKVDTRGMLEFFTPIWRETLRVLKPGAFAFVMCIPRQDCLARMIVSLEDAGFNVSFTSIYWAYASGFPKAQNIGKAVDKRLGKEPIKVGFKRLMPDMRGDNYAQGKREYGGDTVPTYYTKPATLQAQALDGSYGGFQPKPAVEVVIVAMKPLSEKTYVDQALKNGKGVSWLDEGRIPYKEEKPNVGGRLKNRMGDGYGFGERKSVELKDGRFPANLLVSDDALNDGRMIKGGHFPKLRGETAFFGLSKLHSHRVGAVDDSGSFSRYFSLDAWFEKKLKELPKSVQKTFPFLIVAKASKAEKNRGCEELYWEKDDSTFGYHQIDRERWEWLGKEEERIYKETGKRVSLRARGNIHPTVKPLKLVCYLITIGSRPGDVIVDPFMGSGTTPIAATILKRHYIAFETEAENVKIAKARLSAIEPRLI